MGSFVSKEHSRWAREEKEVVTVRERRSNGREQGDMKPLEAVVDRPAFHVMAEKGWINDPNGPVKVDGTYHLFYQHVPNKTVWDFGIVWGHATSTDLVKWTRHPHALEPTPGSLDADGCFSGCCVAGLDGSVNILYTGVRKRDNPDCGPHPHPDQDLGLEFIESQLAAVALPGDTELKEWTKQLCPAIPFPPKNLPLTGWRDPFVLPRGPLDDSWTMLMGSGIKDQGGAVMIYKSTSLTSGWYFDGFLASGDGDTGAMWECPLLAKLPHKSISTSIKVSIPKSTSVGTDLYTLAESATVSWEPLKPGSRRSQSIDYTALLAMEKKSFRIPTAVEHVEEAGFQHFFCISPDAPENPVLYWLGDYRDGKFIIEEAKGPFLLDLGDVIYAPNMLQDEKGAQTLWGWIRDLSLEEAPLRGDQEFSGCLSTPRKLSVQDGKLIQEPVSEVLSMRSDVKWQANNLAIGAGIPQSIGSVRGQAIDMELTFTRGSSTASGFLLHPLKAGCESAAVIYEWSTSTLEVIVDPEGFFPGSKGVRRSGGTVSVKGGKPLTLRVLIDYSSIEIFTSSGEVLTTRVYRGPSAPNCNAGIDFIAVGGACDLTASAYQVNSIWGVAEEAKVDNPVPLKETVTAPALSTPSVDNSWWASWSGIPASIVIY